MRAATALLSAFSSGGTPVWRGDERPADELSGPVLASGFGALDRELPGGGWPQGQLTELLRDEAGIGELSLLAPALAQLAQQKRSTIWVLPPDGTRGIDAQVLPYAPALAAAGVDLARTIFVKPATPREGLWAIEQALRAQHLGAVIGWLPVAAASADSAFKALRRLHLLAQRHGALAFMLRDTRHAAAPSPAALRLQLASDGAALMVNVLKRRGRPLLEPLRIMLQPAHWQRAQVAPETAQPSIQPPRHTALLAARSLQALLDH